MGRHVREDSPIDHEPQEPHDRAPDLPRDSAVGTPPTTEADRDDQPPRTPGLGSHSWRRRGDTR